VRSKDLNTFSYRAGRWQYASANIIAEQAVTLTVNNQAWLTFMCTPGDLEAMGIGFLYNEEIIERVEEVASVYVCSTGDHIDIWLNHSVKKSEEWTRTSGCSGGRTSVAKNLIAAPGVTHTNGNLLPAGRIGELMGQLGAAQDLYRKTGGVHTSALSDGEKLILVAEDIGRHNTLDKLAGRCLLERISMAKKILLTTGRISSEMIQKAGRMGATIVISRTSPSTLSVQMAEKLGITLIGYAKSERFIVYSHPERILFIPTGKTIRQEVK
jgi:FdhD protein